MLFTILVALFTISAPVAGPPEQKVVEAARTHFDAGQYAQAVTSLTGALRESPNDPAINYWLARCYYEQRSYDQAITYAETAVKLAPLDGEYQRWLGRAYGAKAEQSHSFFLARKVKQAFEAAVRLAPRSIEARRDLMQYLAEAPWIIGGDKGKAREQVQAISQMDPVQGHLAQAAYLATQKKWNEARDEYLAVLAQHPQRTDPYMEAADFFADRKDPANLERVINEAGAVNAHDPRLNFYRAVVMILRGTDRASANKLLNDYIVHVPERSDYPSHESAKRWLAM